MPTPSPEIIGLLSIFAVAMTMPTFAKSLVLIYGTILTPGLRTVSAVLRVMGLADLETFGNYHRVLNRDRWSLWVMSQLLLALLIRVFVPEGAAWCCSSMKRWSGDKASTSSTKAASGVPCGRRRIKWSPVWAFAGATSRSWWTCRGAADLGPAVSGRTRPIAHAPAHPPAAGTWADQRAFAQAPSHQYRLGAVVDRQDPSVATRPGDHAGR